MPSRMVLAVVLGGLLSLSLVAVGQSQPAPPPAAASLAGVWQIVTLIDDGALIPPPSIGDHFVKDARLTITGNTLTLTRPGDTESRKLPFVVDATTTPNTLDLAGASKTGSRGIYLHNGDTLIVCLGGPTSTERPTEFASRPGSGSVFMTLQRLKVPVGGNPPMPMPVPLTPPAEPAPSRDMVFRDQLIGTWGHQTDDRVSYTTLNSDGTFSSTLTWKRGFRKMFHGDVRNSGTWKVEDGSFVVHVTASTDSKQQNQLFVSRISSIDGRQAVFVDQNGRPRTEWKVH